MCGQEYVWTDQHTDKVKRPKMKFRVYSSWLTSFVSSSMLKSLCLSLFDDFYIFLTDRQTKKSIVGAPPPALKNNYSSVKYVQSYEKQSSLNQIQNFSKGQQSSLYSAREKVFCI